MKILSQNGLTELISKIKSWGNSTFLNKTEVEQTTVLSIDSTPTANSNNLVTSGGVQEAIDAKYTKPDTGIPASDLASDAKASSQTITIAVADWSGGTTCTKSVTGVTATSIIIVDTSDGNVECTGQGSGTLTFTANSTPTSAVTVKVVIM